MKALSIDVGFSSIKFAYDNADGLPRVGKIVTAISKFPENRFGDTNCVEYNGNFYYIGELALKSPTETLVQLNSYEDLRDIYPVIINYIVNNLTSGGVEFDKLAIGLSIAHLEYEEDLIGWVSRECDIDQSCIEVYPQGVSSKYTISEYGMDISSKSGRNTFKNYIGVDIGFNTVDVFNVINNQCSISSTYGFKDSGIVYICSKVSEKLKAEGINLGIQDIKEYVETGEFQYRGRLMNINEMVNSLIKPYTIDLIHAIEEKSKSSIDKSERIIITGGGANLIKRITSDKEFNEEMNKFYGSDFIVIPDKPELYNVLGYKIASERTQ